LGARRVRTEFQTEKGERERANGSRNHLNFAFCPLPFHLSLPLLAWGAIARLAHFPKSTLLFRALSRRFCLRFCLAALFRLDVYWLFDV
jgi:hypothetical protein